jgi:hypothetical protein
MLIEMQVVRTAAKITYKISWCLKNEKDIIKRIRFDFLLRFLLKCEVKSQFSLGQES